MNGLSLIRLSNASHFSVELFMNRVVPILEEVIVCLNKGYGDQEAFRC